MLLSSLLAHPKPPLLIPRFSTQFCDGGTVLESTVTLFSAGLSSPDWFHPLLCPHSHLALLAPALSVSLPAGYQHRVQQACQKSNKTMLLFLSQHLPGPQFSQLLIITKNVHLLLLQQKLLHSLWKKIGRLSYNGKYIYPLTQQPHFGFHLIEIIVHLYVRVHV